MSPPSRRNISSFSLSFLDIMFCGFGAVVLLVLVLNTNITKTREQKTADLQQKLSHEQLLNQLARNNLERIRQDYAALQVELEAVRNTRADLVSGIKNISASITTRADDQERKHRIDRLQEKLRALENQRQVYAARNEAKREAGHHVRRFEGEGNRQYLTGLKLGGARVLIMVDLSASMLDTRVVDIIRRKIMDENSRKTAPKWRQTVSTVEWLIANLPAKSAFQLVSFNTTTQTLSPGDKDKWTQVTDSAGVNEIVAKLHRLAPDGGTDLGNAFTKARTMSPPPDNIILLTDGLPTLGKGEPRRSTVSGEKRARLFEQAVKDLPKGIPVNVILYPLEGDPLAPVLYWKLAVDSGGSFLTPSSNWP